MSGILQRRAQRALDHLGHLRIRYRAVFVGLAFKALLHEPPTPFADRVLVKPRDVRQPPCSANPRPMAEPRGTDPTASEVPCAAEPAIPESLAPPRSIQQRPHAVPPFPTLPSIRHRAYSI